MQGTIGKDKEGFVVFKAGDKSYALDALLDLPKTWGLSDSHKVTAQVEDRALIKRPYVNGIVIRGSLEV